MRVHLIDGTWELFRAYYAPGAAGGVAGTAGVRGLVRSLLRLVVDEGATHVACAYDHVVESFRNDLFEGYKTGEGIEPELLAQFPIAEEASRALGMVVWPMVEFEADDALATAAARLAADERVEQVVICSPDKDLAQCVSGERVVCLDRMRGRVANEAAVRERYGIAPASIPDWLALVGDSADGFPGIPRWGAKSASRVLGRYEHLEAIPESEKDWDVMIRGAAALARNLREQRDEARLYRTLATLRTDVPLTETLEDLEWRGAVRGDLVSMCERTGDLELPDRVPRWR